MPCWFGVRDLSEIIALSSIYQTIVNLSSQDLCQKKSYARNKISGQGTLQDLLARTSGFHEIVIVGAGKGCRVLGWRFSCRQSGRNRPVIPRNCCPTCNLRRRRRFLMYLVGLDMDMNMEMEIDMDMEIYIYTHIDKIWVWIWILK